MNKADLILRLNELGFDKNEYWVVAGGAMVLYGLREETGDIDLGCSTGLADKLESEGCNVTMQPDGRRRIQLGDDVELFENWLYDKVITVEDVPVISLSGLAEMKHFLGRDKDLNDIKMIEAFLRQ